ncbi:MAG: FIST C-terminal domain-containing protein [Treponema sp.]|jgi:hypothetical protein|nr:FIST C-terminal domain-containing protein [Treponema sp.]
MTALSAFTFEIDEPENAVQELIEQIGLHNLKSHSLGIINCSPAFVETGVVKAISAALPFEVTGCTTAGTASSGELGELMLSLLVLTSDNVDFSTGVTEPLTGELDSPIEAAWRKATAGKPEKPAMILAFGPFLKSVGGEAIVESINRISGRLPVFGTLAIDSTSDATDVATFLNGEAYPDALTFALLYGDIHPSFYMASIPDDKIQKQKGIITKSKDNILMEVNDTLLLTYVKGLGLKQEDDLWDRASFPFIIDYNDGTKPVARSIYNITTDGYAACGGFMPENSTIALGSLDFSDVLRTTSETVNTIMEEKEGSCLIMFACLYRFMMLGANTTAEMEKIQEEISGKRVYQFCYSGGEICPVYTEAGTTVNRFHNCTFIVCRL